MGCGNIYNYVYIYIYCIFTHLFIEIIEVHTKVGKQKASDFSIGEGLYVLDLVEAELLIFSDQLRCCAFDFAI